ncbi:MAG: chromosome partitioning protein ParA [Suipraeoptans sp.]
MRIKIAIVERDNNFLDRIVSTFNLKYAETLTVYSFTDYSRAVSASKEIRFDMVLISETMDVDISEISYRCAIAYLVESIGIDKINDQWAISKYQRIDLIYKQILSIYSEKMPNSISLESEIGSGEVLIFCSPGGGVGSSSMAAATSVYFARNNKKTLYLNFERFGASDVFFNAPGQFDMSDIIFALKSRKTNLALKLESCVKQDNRGVFFYSKAKSALDILELKAEEIINLISELKITGGYDYIIIDTEFSLGGKMLKIYNQASSLIFVSDGTEVCNSKIQRAFFALQELEQNDELHILSRISLIYNKFRSKLSVPISSDIEINSIGGAPRYEHANTQQIITQLSMLDFFAKIS